jgi:hypothetical protein
LIKQLATIKAAQGNLPNGVTRHGRIQAAITPPRKRSGTNIDTPAAKRRKNDYLTQLVSDDTKVVKVRLYKDRLDWNQNKRKGAPTVEWLLQLSKANLFT